MGCKSSIQVINREHFCDVYVIGEVLGTGSFGQVRECMHKQTKQSYAVKMINKLENGSDLHKKQASFNSEIDLLRLLDHPNIIKLYEIYVDSRFFYAIFERCDGGELFDFINNNAITENKAKIISRQVLSALIYLHSKKMIHRDVKAENLIFKSKTDSILKLVDFGMAIILEGEESVSELCGSPHYISPEILKRNYDFKADIWAFGVVVYLQLYGRYPFDGPNTNAIVTKIIWKDLAWNDESAKISPEAIDFMKSLLERDPDKRPTAEQALDHIWLQEII